MSDEESQAKAALEEAIEKYFAASGQPGLLLDWVLVTHRLQADQESATNEMNTCFVGAAYQPMYRTLGLLQHAVEEVSQIIKDGEADGNSGF